MIKKFGIIFQAEEEEGYKVREYIEHNPKTKMIFTEEATSALLIIRKNRGGMFYKDVKIPDFET